MAILGVALAVLAAGAAGGGFGKQEGAFVRLKDGSAAPRKRVAVVMHGSARSFLFPRVHASIKRNLIDALQADVDIFVRTTTQDNIHGKNIDAAGLTLTYGIKTINQLQTALSHVQVTEVVYFNLTDDKERMESEFPAEKHQLFQEFDPRRYSMYYHRHMVYMMAKTYEKAHGFTYDWFVHARLDAAWGSPIDPVSTFKDNGIWLPDRWIEHQPDTFAMVPSQYAAKYFELEYHLEVMCLGGPDFDDRQCKMAYLKEKGFDDAKSKKVYSSCCTVQNSGNGHSEWFLEQLFNRHRLVAYYGNFFMVVVRDRSPGEMCGMLNSNMHLYALMWTHADVVSTPQIQNQIPSMSYMIGCQQMLSPSHCEVESEHVLQQTNLGQAEYDIVKNFKCEDIPDQSWVPVHLQTASAANLCVTAEADGTVDDGAGTRRGRKLAMVPCVEYYNDDHPGRPWHRHKQEQMFMLRNGLTRIQSFVKDERGTCLGVNELQNVETFHDSCFSPSDSPHAKGIELDFELKKGTSPEGYIEFRQGDNCLAVNAQGGKMLPCNAADKDQQFLIKILTPAAATASGSGGSSWAGNGQLLCKPMEYCDSRFQSLKGRN
jgi:hypothetical protein